MDGEGQKPNNPKTFRRPIAVTGSAGTPWLVTRCHVTVPDVVAEAFISASLLPWLLTFFILLIIRTLHEDDL